MSCMCLSSVIPSSFSNLLTYRVEQSRKSLCHLFYTIFGTWDSEHDACARCSFGYLLPKRIGNPICIRNFRENRKEIRKIDFQLNVLSFCAISAHHIEVEYCTTVHSSMSSCKYYCSFWIKCGNFVGMRLSMCEIKSKYAER